MSLGCLLKQYFFIVAGSGGVGLQVPAILNKYPFNVQKVGLVPTPMVYERDGCSRRFFPKVEFGHVFNFWEIGKERGANLRVNPPKDKGQGEVAGCLVAKSSLSANPEDRYVFFEMAMMNDRIGWSLWADSYEKKTIASSSSIGWEYKLFLLEKGKDGDWKVNVGYHWRDGSFPLDNREIHIDLPGRPKWVSRKVGGSQVESRVSHYSAMWKQDNTKDREIFEPIRVWSRDEGKSDIFGAKGGFKPGDRRKGYYWVGDFYHTGWRSWGVHARERGNVKVLAKVDIGGVLEKWYEPFRGKHGRWVPFRKYCGDRRNMGREEYFLGCKMVVVK